MSERKERIAELYYQSGTVKFGAFKLSAHRDNPDLPLSPWYLHYPKDGEPGTELLPELYELVGEEFYEICETHIPVIKPKRLAAVPKGALPLVDAHAQHYSDYPSNLVVFGKEEFPDGRTEFTGPKGEWDEGDELVIGEDHTSGGRNKKLIRAAAQKRGFAVKTMLTVVDRQQGGVQNMAAEGVDLLAVFTADALLQYGLAENHITPATFEEVQEYRSKNQY